MDTRELNKTRINNTIKEVSPVFTKDAKDGGPGSGPPPGYKKGVHSATNEPKKASPKTAPSNMSKETAKHIANMGKAVKKNWRDISYAFETGGSKLPANLYEGDVEDFLSDMGIETHKMPDKERKAVIKEFKNQYKINREKHLGKKSKDAKPVKDAVELSQSKISEIMKLADDLNKAKYEYHRLSSYSVKLGSELYKMAVTFGKDTEKGKLYLHYFNVLKDARKDDRY